MKKIDHRRFRATRMRRNLTQREAAEQVGVPTNTFARWERGEMRPTGLTLRAALAWLERKE